MNNTYGTLSVISGFSGAGKGTLIKRLTEKYPGKYALSISATTRKMREGEVDGVDYFFLRKTEFEERVKGGEFFEYARYVDNYYGTPKDYVFKQMDSGIDVILEIEVQGALNVKRQYPEAMLIFVMPPDAKTLYERLKNRGTESEETIRKRMVRAVDEIDLIEEYDHIIVNDDLEECVEYAHHLIKMQRSKVNRQIEFIHNMRNDLSSFLKGENK